MACGTGSIRVIRLSLAVFRNDIDDLIEFVTLSYDPFEGENRNVDEARIEGIEAAYEFAGRTVARARRGDPPGPAQSHDRHAADAPCA